MLKSVIEKHATFPVVEKLRFFKRFLFNFLPGNEDMPLKSYSLIIDKGIVRFGPCYDFLNTSITLKQAKEESSPPLRGKK